MLDNLFLIINTWITGGFVLAAIGCFLWGMVSVLFSPCHLASIPLIIGYVAGQDKAISGREAVGYALLYTAGMFISITLVGLACIGLGRMLGDVGPWWSVAVGILLVWFGLGMLGVATCRMPGGDLLKIKMKGLLGAFILGLAYGILSGSCTFGFIAPILALITTQKQVATGIVLLLLFALGHCLPIATAGSSISLVKRLVISGTMQTASHWFRRAAGILIVCLGLYFMARPFVA
ncbi:MAG: cytochrome C biosynthesis protein [Deltaproteobacteria bacterium RIFOXYD12_FULL_57_12]|nr:MAG: cytochrome C biosynthesis protein [Deltaproteobacteria bacterium RIFOXYD12_FULL_57_12]